MNLTGGVMPIERSAWECPRCHQINAPHVDQCVCQPEAGGMTYNEIVEKYFPSGEAESQAPVPDWFKKLHDTIDAAHPPSKPWDIDRFRPSPTAPPYDPAVFSPTRVGS